MPAASDALDTRRGVPEGEPTGDQSGDQGGDVAGAQAARWPGTAVAMAVAVAVVVALHGLLYSQNSRYFFLDDRQADATGKLMDIGRLLRAGQWPWLTTSAVASGGHAVEYQNGVFNPLNLLLSVGMSHARDVALASLLYTLVYAVLLTAAGTWLGRLLGLRVGWAVAVGSSIGFQQYTVLWGAGWYQALTSFTWFVTAFAAAVAFAQRGRRRYGWLLLFATYSCATSGWPLAIPFLGVTMAALVLARVVQRLPWRRTLWLGAWYAGGAVASLVALYPLFSSFTFASRNSAVRNPYDFNVVPLSALLHFADPTYWAFFNSFDGFTRQDLPHFYVAWFALPVLVLTRWSRPAGDRHTRAVLGAAAVALLLAAVGTQGPERLLVFRFPSRFLQYTGLFLVVVAAVLAARGGFVVSRRRLGVLLGLLALLAVGSWQSDPGGLGRVAAQLGAVTALSVAVWLLARRRDRAGAVLGDVVVAGGTALLLGWLALSYPMARGTDYGFPSDLSSLRKISTADYTLFYGTYPAPYTSQRDLRAFYASFRPSSMGLMVGERQVNGYSPLGYTAFRTHFQMDDQGNFIGGADAFAARDPQTGLTWLELLRVDQVVATLGPRTDELRHVLPAPWRLVRSEPMSTLWRGPSYRLPGLVSWAAPGVTVRAGGCPTVALTECEQVAAGPSGGRVVYARLWYPGYRVTLDGHDLPVVRHADLLVSVDLPPGAHGQLQVSYRSPGLLRLGGLAVVVLVGLAVASVVVPPLPRRRSATPGRSAGAPAQPPTPPDRDSSPVGGQET